MSITVEGILPDPMGLPMTSTPIRVVTINSEHTPFGSEATKVTDKTTGAYSFILQEGQYLIDIKQDDEFTEGTEVLIDGTLTGSIDLATLIANHKVQEQE
ncbi:hypothetical protein NVP1238A_29 [Vibrio phage 1.238.A._10N.261.52.F10]|uniref:Uncharacterized protein n=2 Tax=Pariacacavirus TaxID=2948856 RepID=A0A2I7RUF0_9CAUD|nr:hypothetical protein KNT79_gp29 [Vibrio phage 1.238.A._10N.261.52.F10]YP_010093476.1 hypothetical protein KNT80_gp33 [Vibrio phage 1.245.O._10N.261.54.C7]AUR97278.1 hypothetical protein NVP1238A_29 [Vibrio phage 1.238.A._10N.261.52.F10]AUR97372.1 hypothetical protein NVP1238B_30 [Vibrio phage 1.238.B._10N.261.52.F10]AUR97946.1 hypothetical protein NVP1245O_33 [Vibrio phage 1.245.O._10N.261.54.C7]